MVERSLPSVFWRNLDNVAGIRALIRDHSSTILDTDDTTPATPLIAGMKTMKKNAATLMVFTEYMAGTDDRKAPNIPDVISCLARLYQDPI